MADSVTPSPGRHEADPMGVFAILSSRRRRMILRLLHGEDDVGDIGALAQHIAAHEADISPRDVSSEQRKRVWVSLYQTHLPKLEAGGFIDWTQSSGAVTPKGWTRGLLPLMQDLKTLNQTRERAPKDATRGEDDDGGVGWLRGILGRSTTEGDS